MRKLIGSLSVVLIIILINSSLLLGQENSSIRGMDAEEVKKLEKASDEALADVKELAKEAEKMVAFRQGNEKAYGFPSDLQKLQKMKEATESFEENELDDIVEFYESLQDKYNASGANDLNVAMSKIINPFPERKTNFPWSANTLEQNLAWFNEFKPNLEKVLQKAEEQAETTAAEQNKAKQLVDFPDDVYDSSDLSEIKVQMLKALLGSVIKNESEVTGIAVISDWVEGKYTDTKQLYRKINGTMLFADNDDDGISRFTSYVFISNEVDGDWQSLKFKSFCNGCAEGWTEAGSGSMASSGKGLLGTLLWFILALANILAGLIVAKTMLNKYHSLIEKVISILTPYSIQIGLIVLSAGILSFIISMLGLRLLYGVIPQLTAVLLGIILAYDYIQANAKGKLKDQMENSQEMVSKVNVYAQTIGIIGLAAGFVYLLSNGSFYFI